MFAAVPLVAGLLTSTPRAAGQLQRPLMYRFETGDRAVYERRTQTTRPDGTVLEQTVEQVRIWCVEHSPDTRLLIERARVTGDRQVPIDGLLLTLEQRGARAFSEEYRSRIAPIELSLEALPRLPAELDDPEGWTTPPDLFGRVRECRRAGADPAMQGAERVDFEQRDPTGVDDLLRRSTTGSFWFDADRGLPYRIEQTEVDQRNGRRMQAVMQLRSFGDAPGVNWDTTAGGALERFLARLRLAQRYEAEMLARPGDAEELLRATQRVWQELLLEHDNPSGTPVGRVALAERRRFAESVDRLRRHVRLAREWVGRPAAGWTLQTLDGSTVTSEAVRDRPVLECFWSAASPVSLRMLGPLERLRGEIPETDVRIVAINIDVDMEQAKRAATRCGPKLRHVLAGPPLRGQAPEDLPVLRLLDGSGRVVAVSFGWNGGLGDLVAPVLPEPE